MTTIKSNHFEDIPLPVIGGVLRAGATRVVDRWDVIKETDQIKPLLETNVIEVIGGRKKEQAVTAPGSPDATTWTEGGGSLGSAVSVPPTGAGAIDMSAGGGAGDRYNGGGAGAAPKPKKS